MAKSFRMRAGLGTATIRARADRCSPAHGDIPGRGQHMGQFMPHSNGKD
jgi:hypothetical protein